jgi:uncharacterized RDD family membrane protein YckC
MTTSYSGYQGYPPSSESAVNVVPVVGLWRRFFATLIDGIVLGLVGCVTGSIFGGLIALFMGMGSNEAEMASLGLNLLSNCFGLALGAVYHIAFWATTGQTPGKMALGLRIVTETGEKPNLSVAVVRYIMYFLGGLILYIGFAIAAFDSKKQALHDKIAKTYVVPSNAEIPVGPHLQFVPQNPSNQADILGVALYYGLFCIVPILIIGLLTVMGPQIGEVFESITTPVPVRP